MKERIEYFKSISIPKKILFILELIGFLFLYIYYIYPNSIGLFKDNLFFPSDNLFILYFIAICFLFIYMFFGKKINYLLLLINLSFMVSYIPFVFIISFLDISS